MLCSMSPETQHWLIQLAVEFSGEFSDEENSCEEDVESDGDWETVRELFHGHSFNYVLK